MDKKDISISEGEQLQPTVSRRDFLKLIGLGAGGLVLNRFLPDVTKNVPAVDVLSSSISSLISIEGSSDAIKTEEFLIDLAGERGNLHHLPYFEVLKTGIDEFQSKNPNTPVVWEKNKDYLNDVDAAKILTTPIKAEEIFFDNEKYTGKIPIQLLLDAVREKEVIFTAYSIFYNRLPGEVQAAINVANTEMVAIPGTKLYVEHYPKLGNVFSDEDVNNYYESIKRDFENKYKQKDEHPLEMSTLLAFFLEKNNGRLQPSLGDMSGFLKYIIRSYWVSGAYETKPQIDWARSHVLDQINQNFSLNKVPFPDDLSGESRDTVLSVWGLIYHVPYLVSMLSYVSPSIVRAATVYEYVTHKHVASAYKIKVDTEIINSLDKIFTYLQRFE